MPDRIPEDPLRTWELNESHDRFDYKQAWPSNSTLHLQFSLLAAVNAIVAVACLVLILSILRYRKVRKNPFNLYILFVTLPDFWSSALCLLTCAMSAANHGYYSEAMCGFQSFYLVFGFTANCWMNAVIVYEVHRLLRMSHKRARYQPPSRQTVLKQTTAVYLYSLFWGLIGVWKVPGLPHQTLALYGLACFPHEYDFASTLFNWLVFVPCFMVLPICYASVVVVDVVRRKLLPPTGRRRGLALYFSRVILVYYVMWIPGLIVFCFLGSFIRIPVWVFWAGAAWSHFQGFVSSLVATTRPQIRRAVRDYLRCVRDERPRRAVMTGDSSTSLDSVSSLWANPSSREFFRRASQPNLTLRSSIAEETGLDASHGSTTAALEATDNDGPTSNNQDFAQETGLDASHGSTTAALEATDNDGPTMDEY